MYCKYCGKEIAGNEEICIHCGKRLRSEPFMRRMYSYDLTKLKLPKESKNPGVAAAIGFFLGWICLGPLGYVYLGQWNWFWITFVVEIVAYALTLFFGAYIILPIIFAIHQYQMAKDLNEMLAQERKKAQEEPEAAEGTGPVGE
ncbi:MAG: zinc ribbon domain-containing protein [bacterium]|nr:MAG: zinc ribbon domain-containing protein [bacterium]